MVRYVLLRCDESDDGLSATWAFVGVYGGRTKREAWEEAERTPEASLPGDGERADFRLVPLSAWGEEFSATGKATFVYEVKGL